MGRWLSTDPYGQYWSPYVGMGNNPMNRVDLDGGTDDPIRLKEVTILGKRSWFASFWGGIKNFFKNIDWAASDNYMASLPNYGGITYFGKYGSGTYWERTNNQFYQSIPFSTEAGITVDLRFTPTKAGNDKLIGGAYVYGYNSTKGELVLDPKEGYVAIPATEKLEVRLMPQTMGVRALYTHLPSIGKKTSLLSLRHQYDVSVAFKTGTIKVGQLLNLGTRKIHIMNKYTFSVHVFATQYFVSTPEMRQAFYKDLTTTYLPSRYRK
ncbi:hypothetical protein AAG747_28535 [Rapidithrix thailandica]|uniref:RHS repeat-associated core domain-containing protein n=1 Tax=Rapidithrix thailandica TaxID=413964 RepID=A0AAW9SL78_9BACT